MKRSKRKQNLFIIMLILIFSVLSFVSYNVSFSVENQVTSLEPTIEHEMSDEEVWEFLNNMDNVNNIGSLGVKEEFDIKKVEVAKKNDKEDPSTVVKKNNEIKGKAKETNTKEAKKKYETNETSFGIDVSTWQGKINWKKVKASGVNFAMIRVGFRRLETGNIVMDDTFLDNIKGAIANNINVGVYFFSMAKNSSEALEEARFVVNMIKDYDITYPVAIDTEIFNKYRLKGVSYSTLTNNALVFCEYVKKQGYTPMIYSYTNAFTKYFDTAKFSGQRIWLAQYNDTVTYKGTYHMWQYTSSGSVPGITGRVDMNVAYFSVTNDVTKSSTINGITNQGNLDMVEFIDMEMKTKLSKDVSLRSSPYTNLPNKAGTLNKGTNVTITGMGKEYIRLLYNEDTFYVKDTDCFIMNLEEVNFDEVKLIVKVNKEVDLLEKPYNFLKDNVVGKLEVSEEVTILGLNSSYVKVLIGSNIYYVNDIDFYDVVKDSVYLGSGHS